MIELLQFLISQFFNFFNFLDELILFNNLSLLKVLIILSLFYIAFSFLKRGGHND